MLIEGLQRLEYRGYDSSGVCVHGGESQEFFVEKAAGKVSVLKDKVGSADIKTLRGGLGSDGTSNPGYAGIAHTRWATHGKPTNANAHPHVATAPNSQQHVADQIAVVHNGIIENYAKLKHELEVKGYVFNSETDSEVLAVLVMDMRKELGGDEEDLVTIVSAALDVCVGTFGCVFMFKDKPDRIIGARRGSPLILGLKNVGGCAEEGEETKEESLERANSGSKMPEFFMASDACAIVKHTRDVIYIKDGETVELTTKGYKIHDTVRLAKKARTKGSGGASTDGGVENPIVRLEMQLEQIEKGGYDHFMLKEIHDQPVTLANCIRGRLKKKESGGTVLFLALVFCSSCFENWFLF